MASNGNYSKFLDSKIEVHAETGGIDVADSRLHPTAYQHQRDAIRWALRLGRALLGMSFGMGKTHCQIEIGRIINEETGGRFLFVAPLGVKHVFVDEEGPRLGVRVQYVRNDDEVLAADTPLLITNYERVRDGSISASLFTGVSLDEGSVLRTLGTKTTRSFIEKFSSVPYRFVATATPAPNRYLELLNYAQFLGVMDNGQGRTQWFKRNSTKAHDLQLLPHKEKDFWLWVSSWALFLNKPSDLGYSDEGYSLPELQVHWHRIGVDHTRAWNQTDKNGQHRLILDGAAGVVEASHEKRATMDDRIAKMVEIMTDYPDRASWIIWHHLEDERKAITNAVPGATAVYGSQSLEKKESLILGFSRGQFPILATKPEIAGSGCNFQEHCADAIFLGVNYEFESMIQAVHRLHRYGQHRKVNIHFIYAESEDGIVEVMRKKWARHDYLVGEMQIIMKRYGLSLEALRSGLARKMGVQRRERRGRLFTMVHNDCVLELDTLPADTVDLIFSSIPFGDQYEYVGSYNDFGHNQDNAAFFRQMAYLIPNLLRVLKPGRICAIHCKDRVRPGRYQANNMMTIEPFSDEVTRQFVQHGFIYAGRITLTTDVVRENAQTYRLGWSEMAKDGSKMGVGMPEYIQLFRKAPTDTSNAYADEPVVHSKTEYSRARWQVDAHAFYRSNGNTLLEPEEIAALHDLSHVYQMMRAEQASHIYDYNRHVAVCEALDAAGKLPASFMLVPTQSVSDRVWADIMQARTLNTTQSQRRLQNHVCPLPLDVVSRCIERYSNPGDLVLDPFSGLGTVPYQAVKQGRRGYGVELSEMYWETAVGYCEQAERDTTAPTLFDFLAAQATVAVQ